MDKKQRNKVETNTIVSMMRSFEKMPNVSALGRDVNTLSEVGNLPTQSPVIEVSEDDRCNPADIKNRSGNVITDVTSNQLHYMTELKNLCQGDVTSIDFNVLYVDDVNPTSSVVTDILEKRERLLSKANKSFRTDGDKKKIITTYNTQNRGGFTQRDVTLYIAEFDQYVNTLNMTLPPFARDKIQNTWSETLRCYIETKKLDRLNDYIVSLKLLNFGGKDSRDWGIMILARSRPVSVDASAKWVTMESHAYNFT